MTDPLASDGFGAKGEDAAGFGGPKLARQPISEQVAGRILGMVKSGNLRPGDRLPTEAQMAVAFGISRPPLREALKALTIMGVLESRQGGRYSVTDLSPSRLVAPFNAMLSVAEYDIDEHFECRQIVDVELGRLCTRRATPDERTRIMQLAHDGQAFLTDPIGFRLLDYEFHQALNAGAHNAMLATVALGLYDVALDARRIASAAPRVIPVSVQQHIEVAEAVMAHDEERAVAAVTRHLEHVRDSTRVSMAQMAQTPERS
jgi:GntR family transcriptional regulator, transcriptional repressor for pyruvate dehydrogenase complex